MNLKQKLWAIKILRAAYKMKKICKFPATAMAAMAIFESDYGKRILTDIITGKFSYNLFGIKCLVKKGKILASGNNGCVFCYTHEENEKGKYLTSAYFRAYYNYEDSFLDYVNVLKVSKDDNGEQRYREAFNYLQNAEQFVAELCRAGYCTDKNYVKNITPLIRQLKRIPVFLLKL